MSVKAVSLIPIFSPFELKSGYIGSRADIGWSKKVSFGIFSIIKTTYHIDFFTVKITDKVLSLSKFWRPPHTSFKCPHDYARQVAIKKFSIIIAREENLTIVFISSNARRQTCNLANVILT